MAYWRQPETAGDWCFVALARLGPTDLPRDVLDAPTLQIRGDVRQRRRAWLLYGRRIAFSTWSSEKRGQVWNIARANWLS